MDLTDFTNWVARAILSPLSLRFVEVEQGNNSLGKRKHAEDAESSPNKRSHITEASRVTLINLLSEDSPYPIQRELCRCLENQDIVNLTRTCKPLSSIYARMTRTVWNFNTHLSKFVKDPLEFRRCLGKSDGLIFGSVANNFFERGRNPGSKMQVLVKEGLQDPLVALMMMQGYQKIIPNKSRVLDWKDTKVVEYCRRTDDITNNIVIVSHNVPMFCFLTNLIMTADANFVSCNAAYSVFPIESFGRSKSFLMQDLTNSLGWRLEKYHSRGWSVEKLMDSYLDDVANASCCGFRYLSDEKIWSIPIYSPVVESDIRPEHLLGSSSFTLIDGRESNGSSLNGLSRMRGVHILCDEYEHPVFRFDHVHGHGQALQFFLDSRVECLFALLNIKLDEKQRCPSALQESRDVDREYLSGLVKTFCVPVCTSEKYEDWALPASWTYYDHLFLPWTKEYIVLDGEEQDPTSPRT